jgi:predicted ArsR family transcriptional regulator
MENKKTPQQIREAKIAKIKTLVQQIQKVTGKKVIFEDAAPTIEKKFDSVSDANGKRTIEKWVSEMPKGQAPSVAAESLLKALKSSGYEFAKKPETEKEPSKVSDSKAPKPLGESKKKTVAKKSN